MNPLRIGLCAMSGIRAHDPELLELGLTLPGFVERSRQVASLPSLGLLTIAACTPEGHELVYCEVPGPEDVDPRLFECDLVAISTLSAQAFEAYALADRLRAHGVLVAFGGLHATAVPDEVLEHADWVAVGEGEALWPRIVDAAACGGPRGILRSEGAVDVRDLPVPRYDLLGDRPYNRFTLQTSRGCPWRCDFCASTVMLSERYRVRPVEDVARDLEALMRVRPEPFLELADDNTFVDKRWGRELCRVLEPHGLKWFTETDVSVADDVALLDAIAGSGCRQLLIGLEHPRAAGLRGVELKTDFKSRTAGRYAEAVDRIQSRGVTVNGCFVLGLDGDTPEVFEEILDFANGVGLYEVQVTLRTPFPGTPLYERLLAEGRLLEPGRWDLCTLFDVNFQPDSMTVDELRAGIHYLSRELYSEEGVRARRRVFHARRQRIARPA